MTWLSSNWPNSGFCTDKNIACCSQKAGVLPVAIVPGVQRGFLVVIVSIVQLVICVRSVAPSPVVFGVSCVVIVRLVLPVRWVHPVLTVGCVGYVSIVLR